MDSVHAWISHVGWKVGASIFGAAKQFAEELVEMCQEITNRLVDRYNLDRDTHYWLLFMSFAGIFFMRGAAPPPSRKLIAAGLSSRLLDFRHPLKYGKRLTDSPL